MKFDKKGQESFEMLIFIIRIIFLVVVLFSFRIIIGKYVTDTLNVQKTQAEIFGDKLYYSPNGILYYDEELKQSIPGTIDVKKITNDNLNALANYSDNSFIAAYVSLLDLSNNVIVHAKYNNVSYDRWLPIMRTGKEGAGGVTEINKTMFVQYLVDGKKQGGLLRVQTLQPGR